MKTITVTVSEQDIALGARRHSYKCPVARAISREAGRPTTVTKRSCWVRDTFRSIDLPPCVMAFIQKFDQGAFVKPFKFRLKLP